MKNYNTTAKTMFCPLCGKTHDVEIITKESIVTIKNEKTVYPKTIYVCHNSDEEENVFIPAKVMDDNLLKARDAYRKNHNMLTSIDIIAIREKYGLTQKEFANMLGWGDVTITRYETKLIQDDTHDELMRCISTDPLRAKEYLEKNKERFEEKRFGEIMTLVEKEINKCEIQYRRKSLEAQYIKYQSLKDLNGNIQLDISKVCAMIDYFARRCKSLFKVKLMKLLWYSDALSYKLYGHAMSGLVYQHKPMGALPVGHYDLVALIPHDEIQEDENTAYRILPFGESLEYSLTEEELNILKTVADKFMKLKGQEIADYMHQEEAYIQTMDNAYIPFHLVKSLSI